MVLEDRLAEISGRTTRVSLPLFLLILFFIVIAYSLVLVLPATQLKAYAREDGLIENAGAIFYLLAAVTMIVTFLRRSSGRFYFLLLAIFFLVCFGEEITWGQRIIGWDTPKVLKAMNAQRETNIHNLWLFKSSDQTGAQKNQIALFLHPGRLIALFWLAYCIILPLAEALFARVRRVLDYTRLPIPPLWVGLLFLAAYLTRKILILMADPSRGTQLALGELQESLYAAIFFILALALCRQFGNDAHVIAPQSLPAAVFARHQGLNRTN